MNVIYQFLTFLVVLGIIVLVHELGHYIAARLMKIRVEVFSFGFGKRLFGKKVGDTDFRVSLFPVGGYVRMAGEEEYDPQNPRPDEFMAKNRAQKIFTLLMGPIMNIVLTFVIFTIINLNGVEKEQYRSEAPRLGYVVKDSPAAKAGLRYGDLIVSINNQRIKNWEELEYMTGTRVKDVFQILYQREGKPAQTHLTVSSQPNYEIGYAGWFYGFKTRISAIEKGSPAERAGLKPNDEIVAINQQPVNFWQIGDIIEANANKQVELSILRLKNKLNLAVVPEMKDGRGRIGISREPIGPTMIVRYGFFRSLSESGKSIVSMTTLVFQVFRKIIVAQNFGQELFRAHGDRPRFPAGPGQRLLQLFHAHRLYFPAAGHRQPVSHTRPRRRPFADLHHRGDHPPRPEPEAEEYPALCRLRFPDQPDGIHRPERHRQDPAQRLAEHFPVPALTRGSYFAWRNLSFSLTSTICGTMELTSPPSW